MATIKDFRKWQKEYPNFMTPDIIKLKQIGDSFIELSEGTNFDHKPLYGVTIIDFNKSFRIRDGGLHHPFWDEVKAKSYFDKVCEDIKKV